MNGKVLTVLIVFLNFASCTSQKMLRDINSRITTMEQKLPRLVNGLYIAQEYDLGVPTADMTEQMKRISQELDSVPLETIDQYMNAAQLYREALLYLSTSYVAGDSLTLILKDKTTTLHTLLGHHLKSLTDQLLANAINESTSKAGLEQIVVIEAVLAAYPNNGSIPDTKLGYSIREKIDNAQELILQKAQARYVIWASNQIAKTWDVLANLNLPEKGINPLAKKNPNEVKRISNERVRAFITFAGPIRVELLDPPTQQFYYELVAEVRKFMVEDGKGIYDPQKQYATFIEKLQTCQKKSLEEVEESL